MPQRPAKSKDPEMQLGEPRSPSLTVGGAGLISPHTVPQERELSHGSVYLPVIHLLRWLMYSSTNTSTFPERLQTHRHKTKKN